MSLYLSFKEIWRYKGRFFLFSLVIALITMLVLFISGLAEGLANANREYLSKLDGELLVFQSNVKLSTLSSRLDSSTLQKVKRIPGVADVGPVGLSSATLVFEDNREDVDISLVGVEPEKPGGAPAREGSNLRLKSANETVIDGNLARSSDIEVGDTITVKSIQGTEEEYYDLEVIGITDGRQYFFQPSIFVSMEVWEKIRSQAAAGGENNPIAYNILVSRLQPGADPEAVASAIESQVEDIEVSDIETAYKATPGYAAQQSTLNTQRGFTLLIGILVIGGFFQIQTLQKIPNIGMLKAIGTGNLTVGMAVVMQILMVTVFGVVLGTLATLGLAALMPAGIPILFTPLTTLAAMLSLAIIGPLGGLVSVYLAVKVEPLMALGLSQ